MYSYKANYLQHIAERAENQGPLTLVDAVKQMAAENHNTPTAKDMADFDFQAAE